MSVIIKSGDDPSSVSHARLVAALRQPSEHRDVFAIAELVSEWVWVTDTENRFVYISDRVKDNIHLPPEHFLGRRREECVNGQPSRELLDLLKLIDARQPFHRVVLAWTGQDHHQHSVEISGQPYWDTDGEFVGYLGSSKCITDQVNQNRELIESRRQTEIAQQRLWDAIEAIPNGFVIFDADDRLVMCNEQYKEIYWRIRDLIVPGVRFEDILRGSIVRGELPSAQGNEKQWIKDRLKQHGAINSCVEQKTADGRHLRIYEKRIASGDVVGFRVDITDLKLAQERLEKANKELEFGSLHDHLTQLPNRRYLAKHINQLAASASDDQQQIAALYIDIDEFKQINDTYGHAAGDHVLRETAKKILECIDDDCFAARTGGDEFVVLLSCRQKGFDSKIAKSLRSCLTGEYPFEGVSIGVNVSVGIAAVNLEETTAEQCLIDADKALYQAKRHGGSRVEVYSHEMSEDLREERVLVRDLRLGLQRNEFFPVYQPRFETSSLRVTGAEALARWRHPSGKILNPGQFLPIAKKIGMTAEIDKQIMRRALQDRVSWPQTEIGRLRLSVNVSASRIAEDEFYEELERLDLRDPFLCLELIETTWFDGLPERVKSRIAEIRELGVRVELDDFGAGHASLSALADIGVDCVKIDRRLICDVETNMKSRVVFGSISGLLKKLGYSLVAEGIETQGQLDLVREFDCDEVQGFGLARPMEQHQLIEFIAQNITPGQLKTA
ncbi:MAG: EAL domain-containing protein [Hyphomicrobiaceae bacterium]